MYRQLFKTQSHPHIELQFDKVKPDYLALIFAGRKEELQITHLFVTITLAGLLWGNSITR